ncbi:hypothetical protein FY036_09755 [Mesorhizobium microcysteis]|uniref:Fibronectin attachment protein n=1 Tax=Neoaquamicrobium microcysteis TaxID=2682781 RepID=A0A5D4GWM7_9HYPH|nr:hypothetical protein FY036_09755 [Mesorhizobium microcysteis]
MTACLDLYRKSNAVRLGAAAGLYALMSAPWASPALALSEIPREDVPISEEESGGSGEIQRETLPPVEGTEAAPSPGGTPVPLPDPVVIPRDPSSATDPADATEDAAPEVIYDVEQLPEPVRRMRALIMEACLTGDIEQLRPLISGGDDGTQLSLGSISGDPVEFLRGLSGDDEGQEILAILYEVLAAGFVHLDENGETGEMYVWPYFFAVPLEQLDSRQRVELFKLVTAGDYEDMKNYGAYIFYRAGISPEGRWLFFVAGD